ncbi:MAG: sigma-70 family RNA polymerase sigma factor [Armatimonadota bacterium]|nr:MAG: sigma-70 family RNA polymerase sigma factor [Armatimonadota bacterium]
MSADTSAMRSEDHASSGLSGAASRVERRARSLATWRDADLVHETLTHSHGPAFDELVRRYRAQVERYLSRRLHSSDAVLDATQETFLRAYEGLHSYWPSCSFVGWLLGIAGNVAHELLRARRHAPAELKGTSESRWASPMLTELTPVAALEERESAARLCEAVASLPTQLAIPAVLRFYHDTDLREIAYLLDLSVGAVKMRLSRARRIMRKCTRRGKLPFPTTVATDLARCYWQLGKLLWTQGHWQQGAGAYAASFVLDDGLGMRMWGDTQDSSGTPYHRTRCRHAEKALRRAIRARPGSSRLWTALGAFRYFHGGAFDESQSCFARALELEAFGGALINMAHLHTFGRVRLKDAFDHLRAAEKTESGNPFYYAILGTALAKSGRKNESLWAARETLFLAGKALTDGARHWFPALQKIGGDIFVRAGLRHLARRCYWRSVEVRPPLHVSADTAERLYRVTVGARLDDLLY